MGDKFQTNLAVTRLYDENNPPPPVTKVGILPFMWVAEPLSSMRCPGEGRDLILSKHEAPAFAGATEIKLLLMKPRAEAKHLGEPAFQLAKGTRRLYMNERWSDMREDDLKYADESFYERLHDTALREGREEVGLKASNIARLFDMGGFTFTSATKGLIKPLHMFAAEMKNAKDFAGFEKSTLETRWMTLEEFAAVGRKDHVVIAGKIIECLEKHYVETLS